MALGSRADPSIALVQRSAPQQHNTSKPDTLPPLPPMSPMPAPITSQKQTTDLPAWSNCVLTQLQGLHLPSAVWLETYDNETFLAELAVFKLTPTADNKIVFCVLALFHLNSCKCVSAFLRDMRWLQLTPSQTPSSHSYYFIRGAFWGLPSNTHRPGSRDCLARSCGCSQRFHCFQQEMEEELVQEHGCQDGQELTSATRREETRYSEIRGNAKELRHGLARC